ncbi:MULTISPECIES: YhcN/YlaJ family sporulation lipoprotein [Paenibacillus]|uniref:Sporulation protein n=1 Tax=Paenibacillus naphthalenovorans TaxID=162209 RepID=A0A0U2KX45_9BACL|nr:MULTISPECIES: YhcN/YlaJ family sporulation lipoprotein [Paenibacillus]ALS21346.1 sporulation protein [Paenibacillus naphthalenovorans]NTZ18493.1 YhcN/YlaJ family sporulation lipoprotein [Paenibacillus sp. JMULE4]GCL72603.1 YhcN/YlaJ family sporulation lipoprotein [Paenibacillus naphthalenovorans]SDH96155.1 sporulation lipoprotein, YhcN/YlaJ family [Paenibacillus naphthalenovorans]
MRKFVALIMLLSAVLTGCTQSPKNGAAPPQNVDPNHQVQVNQTAPQKKEITDPAGVAQRLEQIAGSVPNVESANCVVFGNTAVVGINVPQGMDRAKVGTVKLSVAEALKHDPYGVDALVTADMDLAERLRRVRDHVMNGRPINGFAEEMAAIIGRIVPQVPRDVVPPQTNPNR